MIDNHFSGHFSLRQGAINRLLATAAIALSVLALFMGNFERYDKIVTDNQISVYDLASMIKQRQEIILVDLRPESERLDFSLPGAVSLSTALSLTDTFSNQFAPSIVIYAHENFRDWQPLYKSGLSLSFLNRGIEQWLSKIMSPVVYRFAPKQELALFETHAAISRYFGGLPRYSDDPIQELSAQEQMNNLDRRGCGF